jgi:hypothetical protein
MKAIELYKSFLLKINKNDTNSNISISKGEFVILYNEQKKIWLSEKIKVKSNDIDIHDLERLYVKDKEIKKSKSDNNSSYFKLPDDFYMYDSSYSLAKKEQCVRELSNWLVKPKNVNILLNDTNNSPSFEYEETICIISQNQMVVYKDTFEIEKIFLSYYKEPINIDIEGYIKFDGTLSTDINPLDLDDKSISEIINRCALETIRIYENPEGFSLAQHRIQTEN